MVRTNWLNVVAVGLLTQACAATTQSYDSLVPRPQPDAYSCALRQVNELGYTVQDADRDAGFLRAEKQASGFFTEVMTGNTYFTQLTVSLFEDAATNATRMRVTVGGVEEAETSRLRRGNRKAVAPNSGAKEDGQAILRACGGNGTVEERVSDLSRVESVAAAAAAPDDVSSRPSAAPAALPATAVTEQVRITASAANVRSSAGTNQTVIVVLPRGAVLSVVRKEGSWFVVRLTSEFGTSAETGFVHTSTVEVIEVAREVVRAPLTSAEPQLERELPEPAPTPTQAPAVAPAPRRVAQEQSVPAERNRFGGELSWSDDYDISVGARVELPIPSLHQQLRLVGSFDYYFPASQVGIDLSYFELNAGAAYHFLMEGNPGLKPYAGVGLGIGRVSASVGDINASNSDIGLNLFGGAQFSERFLAELRFRVGGDIDHIIIAAGVLF